MSEDKEFEGVNVDELWIPHHCIGDVLVRPYVPGEESDDYIALTKVDESNGSPQLGDMIVKDMFNNQTLVPKNRYRMMYKMFSEQELKILMADKGSNMKPHDKNIPFDVIKDTVSPRLYPNGSIGDE